MGYRDYTDLLVYGEVPPVEDPKPKASPKELEQAIQGLLEQAVYVCDLASEIAKNAQKQLKEQL